MREAVPREAVLRETVLHVHGMDCSAESVPIQRRLEALGGVSAIDFDYVGQTVTVRHSHGDALALLAAIRDLGMEAEVAPSTPRGPALAAGPSAHDHAHAHAHTHAHDHGARAQTRAPPSVLRRYGLLGLAGAAAVGAELSALMTSAERSPAVLALSVVALVLSAPRTVRKAWLALRTRSITINVLMVVAVTGALAIGEWPEAAMVSFLFAVAEAIEAASLARARHAIRELMEVAPERALVRSADGSFAETDAHEVRVGDRVRVRPGERLALDGVVVEGSSAVDQSPITGESLPVDKALGAEVFAGSINSAGTFDLEVTRARGQTTLDRIARAVQEAHKAKAPTERFVDRFARLYTPAVVALAVLLAALPPLLFSEPFEPWLYKALVLLVIACPCALVISTPVTVVSALAGAARHGILIKGGAPLEAAALLRVLALDKTGTLTEGRLQVTEVQSLNGTPAAAAFRLAASLSARSEHPISKAIARRATEQGVAPLAVEGFRSIPGMGVEGSIDGVAVGVGSHRLAHERGFCSAAVEQALDELEDRGRSSVVVTNGSHAIAVIGVADTLKPTSAEAVRDLAALGVRTVLLSGDALHTARAVARSVGIEQAQGDLLPEDKRRSVQELRREHGSVGMVGDGVNDAPALAEANVGIAMGAAGTGTAIETADVALMDDDPRKVAALVRHARFARRVLVQNIVFALVVKALFFALALAGVATLWMAVFADVGASLIVVGNGLRTLGSLPGRGIARLPSQAREVS